MPDPIDFFGETVPAQELLDGMSAAARDVGILTDTEGTEPAPDRTLSDGLTVIDRGARQLRDDAGQSALDAQTALSDAEDLLDGFSVVATSYDNPGGKGDRTALLHAWQTGMFNGTAQTLIDGDNATGAMWTGINNDTGVNWHVWQMQFPAGYRVVVDELCIRHLVGHSGTIGQWEFVAKNRDETEWTQLWTGTVASPSTSGSADADVRQVVPCAKQFEGGFVKGFDTFAFRGVSGSSTALDQYRVAELELKLGYARDHLTPEVPTGGTAGQVLVRAADDQGSLQFIDVNADAAGSGTRRALHDQQTSHEDEWRSQAAFFLDSVGGNAAYNGKSSGFPLATVGGLLKGFDLVKAGFTKTAGYTNVYEITVDRAALAPWVKGTHLALAYFAPANNVPNWFVPAASREDVDVSPVTFWVENPAARISKLYLHAPSSGNPASDTSSYRIVTTVPPDAGVALRADSVFNDRSLELPLGYRRIGSYGEGRLPFINCGRTVAPGDMALSTDPLVGGSTDVYEATVTREAAMRFLNDGGFNLYEIDEEGRTWPAQIVAGPAAVAARAGTVWFGVPGASATNARTAATARMFFHPRLSTDPTSDGKTYIVPHLKAGVSVTTNHDGAEAEPFDGVIVEGVKTGFQYDGHGALLTNADATVKRCLAVWGSKHNLISKSGRWEHCIAFGGAIENSFGYIAFTFYANDGGRLAMVLKESGYVAPDHYPGGQALYCHDSIGNAAQDAELDGFFTYNGGGVVLAVRRRAVVRDFLARVDETPLKGWYGSLAALNAAPGTADGDWAAINTGTVGDWGFYRWNAALAVPAWEKQDRNVGQIALPSKAPSYVYRPMIRGRGAAINGLLFVASAGATADPTMPVVVKHGCIHALGHVHGSPCIALRVARRFEIEHNFLIFGYDPLAPGAGYGGGNVQLTAATPGSKGRYNVFYDQRPAGGLGMLFTLPLHAGAVSTDWDHNVYVGAVARQFSVGGVSYTVTTRAQFVAYQAAVLAAGHAVDQHSVWLDHDDARGLFVGNPADGDFRMKPGPHYLKDGVTPMQFADGTPLTLAGPQEHLDYNLRAVLPGPPSRWPEPPKTEINSELFCRAPYLWDWYAGQSEIPQELR